MAAVAFIEQLDRKAIKMDDAEYEQKMELGMQALREHGSFDDLAVDTASPSASDKLRQSLPGIEEKARQMFASVRDSPIINKSIAGFKSFIADAERALRDDYDPDAAAIYPKHKPAKGGEEKNLAAMEEYQVRLAMALSLSEQEALSRICIGIDTDMP